MPDPIQLIPLAEIDEAALTRDRVALDPEAMAELQASILAHGLRQPIEVYAFADPEPSVTGPTQLYGLISGHRRLAAVRALHTQIGLEQFATIPAFLREPANLEAALVAMVEENEIRADLSPWERGLVAVNARDRGVFASVDEAVDKLYPAASKVKRFRIRQLAYLVEELDGHLHAPETLSQRNALRLAEACRRDLGDLIRATLGTVSRSEGPNQWDLLAPILAEAEDTRHALAAPNKLAPGRPRRVSSPRHGLTIRRERTSHGYSLHFSGRSATSLLMDSIFDEIDRIFTPGVSKGPRGTALLKRQPRPSALRQKRTSALIAWPTACDPWQTSLGAPVVRVRVSTIAKAINNPLGT